MKSQQPRLGVDVEVVGRLVEQQRVAAGEQDPRQLDTAPLAAAEHADGQLHPVVGQAEAGGDRARLALGGVAARRGELVLGPAVAGDVALARVLLHGDAQLLDAHQLVVDAPAGQHVGDGAALLQRRRRCAGPAAGSRSRPCGSPVPAVGSVSPPSTLNRLVLPAPLRPTRPTLSRGMTVNEASATTSRPPTSTESPGPATWPSRLWSGVDGEATNRRPPGRRRGDRRDEPTRCTTAATGGRAVAAAPSRPRLRRRRRRRRGHRASWRQRPVGVGQPLPGVRRSTAPPGCGAPAAGSPAGCTRCSTATSARRCRRTCSPRWPWPRVVWLLVSWFARGLGPAGAAPATAGRAVC